MRKRTYWIGDNPPTHYPSGNPIPQTIRTQLHMERKLINLNIIKK